MTKVHFVRSFLKMIIVDGTFTNKLIWSCSWFSTETCEPDHYLKKIGLESQLKSQLKAVYSCKQPHDIKLNPYIVTKFI